MKKFFLDSDIDEIVERLDTKGKLEGKNNFDVWCKRVFG